MAKQTILRGEKSATYTSDSLTADLEPDKLATSIAQAVALHHQLAIRSGKKPSGGRQKPLGPDERRRAQKGKRDDDRGMGTKGAFPDSIGSTKARGRTKASAEVAAAPFFDEWQERERSRGVEYLETDGDVDELVDAMILADLEKALR